MQRSVTRCIRAFGASNTGRPTHCRVDESTLNALARRVCSLNEFAIRRLEAYLFKRDAPLNAMDIAPRARKPELKLNRRIRRAYQLFDK